MNEKISGVVSQLLPHNAAVLWVKERRRKYVFIPPSSGNGPKLELESKVEFDLVDGHAVNVKVVDGVAAAQEAS